MRRPCSTVALALGGWGGWGHGLRGFSIIGLTVARWRPLMSNGFHSERRPWNGIVGQLWRWQGQSQALLLTAWAGWGDGREGYSPPDSNNDGGGKYFAIVSLPTLPTPEMRGGSLCAASLFGSLLFVCLTLVYACVLCVFFLFTRPRTGAYSIIQDSSMSNGQPSTGGLVGRFVSQPDLVASSLKYSSC